MNLKEIRDDVRSLIIEPTPGFRSDEELNRWINQGHQLLGAAYRIETFAQIEGTGVPGGLAGASVTATPSMTV